MHHEVIQFLASEPVKRLPWEGAAVVEVGAYNVNGRARDCVPDTWKRWDGIDLVDGPDVSFVGDAVAVLDCLKDDGERFDVAVCTEVLEHAEQWRDIVAGMMGVLKPGGHLVITCASDGRPAHGANGDPAPASGEWYRNVSLLDLAQVVAAGGAATLHVEHAFPPGDAYLVAVMP